MPSTASLGFDGVNDYASAAHHSDLNITGDLTVECWFKASSYNAAAKVLVGFSSDVSGNSPYKLRFNFNVVDFQEYTGYAQRNHTVSVAAVSTSAWHHVAVTRSGRTIQFYLDGSPFGTSTTFTGSASGNTSGVRIGNGVFDNYFVGKMDEVRIWNVARTSVEIAAYYDKKAIGTETGLVACWHLDEGSGSSSADAAGTAQNLTISGATWDVADFPTLTDAGATGAVLAGTSTGTSTAAASSLTLNHALTATSTGTSTSAATSLRLAHALTGTADGTSAASATALRLTHALAGAADGVSTADATRISLNHALVAASTGTSSTTADLTAVGAVLAGTAAGTSTAAAFALVLNHVLSGTSAGVSSASANLTIVPTPSGVTLSSLRFTAQPRSLHFAARPRSLHLTARQRPLHFVARKRP